MYISTIIVAGGSGKRFGGKKQFFKLCGKPLVVWSLEKFHRFSNELILVLPGKDIRQFEKKWLGRFPDLKIAAGGKKRWQSVENGLKRISDKSNIVCIHDGARPLVSKEDATACIKAAIKHGAAILAAPASDTIKLSDDNGNIKQTLDRNKIFLAQTPQVFKRDIILKAFKSKKLSNITDDAQMVEALGHKVKLVPVTSPNIKITTKIDLLIAQKLIREK